IVGNFAGMVEGSVTPLNGAVMQISYQDGDGNDAEMTAIGGNRLFVTGPIVDLLRRFPNHAELTAWQGAPDSGRSRQDVADLLWMTPEHRALEVAMMYTKAGLADDGLQPFYVTVLTSRGANEGGVMAALVTTPAFRKAHPSNRNFVQALF